MTFRNPYRLVAQPADQEIAHLLHRQILWHLTYDNSVPNDVVSAFLNCFQDEKEIIYRPLRKRSLTKAKWVFNRISSRPEYSFKWRTETFNHNGKKHKIEGSTLKVLYECILAFFLYERDTPDITKDQAIQTFYDMLTDHYKEALLKSYQKKFTDYKRMVLAGMLTQAVGFSIANKKKLSNEEIYQATRNAIAKKNP